MEFILLVYKFLFVTILIEIKNSASVTRTRLYKYNIQIKWYNIHHSTPALK